MNDTSSRSHAVFTIRIDGHMKSSAADGRKRKFMSKMNLVDLAGSERQRNTGATGERLREGSSINKSLSVLGTVIMNLVDIGDGRSRHVHYRDSKLTFLLRDSLGGSTYTSIVATVTPKEEHAHETLSTLHFAQRAKSVKNVVTRNVTIEDTVLGLRKEVRKLKKLMSESAIKATKRGGENGEGEGEGNESGSASKRGEMLAETKLALNSQIKLAADLQREQLEMEEKMIAIQKKARASQLEAMRYQKEAQEREEELDRLRVAHAMKVSERRRSSVGLSSSWNGGSKRGRESILFPINESPGRRESLESRSPASKEEGTTKIFEKIECSCQTDPLVEAAPSLPPTNLHENCWTKETEDEIKERVEQAVEQAVARANKESTNRWEEKESTYQKEHQRELDRLREEVRKARQNSGQISVAASEEQSELNKKLFECQRLLKQWNQSFKEKDELLTSKEEEVQVLRGRIAVMQRQAEQSSSSSSSATAKKTTVKTLRIQPNASSSTTSMNFPFSSTSSPLMGIMGISLASTSNNPTSATALLADMRKKEESNKGARTSSDSITSVSSSEEEYRAADGVKITRNSKGGRQRKSMRDMFGVKN